MRRTDGSIPTIEVLRRPGGEPMVINEGDYRPELHALSLEELQEATQEPPQAANAPAADTQEPQAPETTPEATQEPAQATNEPQEPQAAVQPTAEPQAAQEPAAAPAPKKGKGK